MAQLWFLLAVALLLATPGPTNALLTTSAALVGVRRSLPLMPAEVGGYLLAISILLLVGHPLLAASPSVAYAVRVILIAYLVWLAWHMWVAGAESLTVPEEVATPRRVFVTTLLNPKSLIFAFGIFPRLDSLRDVTLYYGLFAVTTLAVACGWLTLGVSIGRLAAAGNLRFPLTRVAAVILVGFAGFVAVSSLPART